MLGFSRSAFVSLVNALVDGTTHSACPYFMGSVWGSIYRVSHEEWTKLRESVPYIELYRYNPKHLYPKLNGYGDNGQRSLKL